MSNFNLRPSIIELEDAKAAARNTLLNFTLTSKKTVAGDASKDPFYFTGILKNKPKFSIMAEYDRLINIDDKFQTLRKVGGYFGKTFATSKTWTRKIFKGGSYLSVSLQTRIVDQGLGVIYQTRRLASLCSPSDVEDDEKLIRQDLEKVKGLKSGSLYEPVEAPKTGGAPADGSNPGGIPTSTTPLLGDKSAENQKTASDIEGLLDGAINNSPPILKLFISNYFQMEGFYAKSVDWEFSHEQTANGPLYADVNIELENWEIQKSIDLQSKFLKWK